jgi:hypothetical protein
MRDWTIGRIRALQLKRWARTATVVPTMLCIAGVAACNDGLSPDGPPSAELVALLQQPLWRDRDAYDAAHNLMAPLHAAYANADSAAIAEFRSFGQQFLLDTATFTSTRLWRLQFEWLLSRFLVLQTTRASCDGYTRALLTFVDGDITDIIRQPAWQWEAPDFTTLLDRVRWKLETHNVRQSYFRVIIDEDLFALAIAADVRRARRACGLPDEAILADAVGLAKRIFKDEVVATADGGWILQPGAWRDHSDYLFAGHPEVVPGLQPLKVDDVAPEQSHFMRVPLALLSFQCADPDDPTTETLFRSLRLSLATHITKHVLLPPSAAFPGVRLTNYMDGRNGVYRYGHDTQGAERGFGPYEESGAFNLGWWAFLGPSLEATYAQQLSLLPFTDSVVRLYVGPNTTRVRNPVFREPDFYLGVWIRYVVRSAARLRKIGDSCAPTGHGDVTFNDADLRPADTVRRFF